MATFGNTTEETGGYTDWSDQIRVGRFQITEDGVVSKLTAYLDNVATGHKVGKMKGVIYADTAGPLPGALKGVTAEVTIADSAALAWVDFTFAAAVSLTAGYYWLGFHGNSGGTYSTGGVNIRCLTTTGTGRLNWDTYVSGEADPFNLAADSAHDDKIAVYATYTAAGGIGKLAWWLNACKWHSSWEPRPSGLLIPRLATPTI